ncbi:MAG TPA: hypothetical protein VGF84_09250 [Micromonosporaceae bacterium]
MQLTASPPARRRWTLPITLILVLALGAGVAWQVGAALGLTFTPSQVPAEPLTAAPARPAVAAPVIGRIALPAIGGTDGKRIALAAEAVSSALVGRGRPAPVMVPGTPGPAGEAASTGLSVTIVPSLTGEAFRLQRAGAVISLAAGTPAGAADGLYTVADRIRSGTDVIPAGQDGRVTQPRLGLRLTDVGAVGLDADPAAFAAGTDYSLNTDVVGGALLAHAPWVDAAAAAQISQQFRQFVDHALAEGYNGLVLPGFLEYLTFSGVGDGHQVYPANDPHIARAEAMRAAFGPVWQYAHDMGMKIYFQTDMLSLSPPLARYLGHIDTTSPKLWAVYRAGLHELFTTMPYVDGLMIRIGEGGSDYKLAGWDYYSSIDVTTPAAVRAMLSSFLRTADADDRDIIFRTWSVGVGAVGDMHTNPASYAKVLDGIDDRHLIVSTKYSLGDFYSHLPLNTTLGVGTQRRIVEFQSRREFEGLGALPNDLGGLEQQALRKFLSENPNIVGVWDWTQDGGPLYAGPMTLYLRTGFWQIWDLDVYLTSRLAWDPDVDIAGATNDWIRQTFADDPATVSAIAQVFAMSRDAINNGLYIGPYANDSVKALGLAPPPMMWIFEWDIVTGDSAALDSIYQVSRGQLGTAITEGDTAITQARAMQTLIDGTAASSWRDPAMRTDFANTMAYEVNLFQTLGAYRTMVLRHVQWLEDGSASARSAWASAQTRYQAAVAQHNRRYRGDLALPAYNFTAADIGEARADRDPVMAWLARILLALILILLGLGSAPGRRLLRGAPGSAALRGLWLGATRPWRIGSVSPAGRTDRLLVWLIPALTLGLSRAIYTWLLAPAHLVLVLGAWLIFAVALRLLVGRRDPFALWAAVGGAALVRTVILLLALVNRGPGRYWYDFWTNPGLRFFYITVAFAVFLWVFVVAYLGLRDGCGLARRRGIGRVAIAVGAPLVVLGAVIGAMGLERALTIWNDQMALLPWGLSRILGITTYLGIPTGLPIYAVVLGAVVIAVGLALLWRARTSAEPEGPALVAGAAVS